MQEQEQIKPDPISEAVKATADEITRPKLELVSASHPLSESEQAELSQWANAIKEIESELEQVTSALFNTPLYQQLQAVNAKLEWAKVSRDLSFALACSEHGLKAKESRLSDDGKAIEAK